MTRSTFIALISVGLLSACAGKIGGPPIQPAMDPKFTNSIGFTGIGGEKQYVSH
jgi:hypothetical protein